MTRSMIVEFCGLPGSGKSTTAVHARDALREAGIPVRIADLDYSAAVARPKRVLARASASTREAARHPYESLESAGVISASSQHSHRDTAAVLAQWLALRDLIERSRRSEGVHLVEEGLVQTVWTMLLRADCNPAGRLWELVPAHCRPDLVLVVDVPVSVAEQRLTRRRSRHSRTQLLPQDQIRAELRHGATLLERILESTPVLKCRVAGTMPTSPEEMGRRAAAAIVEHGAWGAEVTAPRTRRGAGVRRPRSR